MLPSIIAIRDSLRILLGELVQQQQLQGVGSVSSSSSVASIGSNRERNQHPPRKSPSETFLRWEFSACWCTCGVFVDTEDIRPTSHRHHIDRRLNR
ncbi:hypothetical protein AND_004265 [Anopheles darlingi]|uniref:Uncharacterized protein n=1 Tax=Anopheles darlingi TaxID=43151 RepID=W5JMM0_ANODA|nr:hypothetical protein AND_004265 [Anopheles darlingi]